MRFKKIISVLISLFMLLAAGCRRAVTVEDKPKDDIEGKLVVWTNSESRNLINTSRLSYLALHKKAEIEIVSINSEELKNKLNTAIKADERLPDIICLEDQWAQPVIKDFQSILEEAGDDIKKDNYLKYKVDNLMREGKLYGIPFNAKPGVLVLRKDYLQQAKVNPDYIKTWGDFISAGKSILKATGKPMTAFAMENDNLFRRFLNQLGGNYFSKESKPALNSDKAVRAADMLKKLYSEGVVKTVAGSTDILNEFRAGNICSAIVSPEDLDAIADSTPELKGKLLITRLPAYEEGGNQAVSLNGSSMLLVSGSKSKKLMVDFAKFITENRENVKALMTTYGSISSYTGFYEEKWYSSVDDYYEGQKRWKLLSSVAKDIYSMNYTENYSRLRQPVKEAIDNIVLKGTDIRLTLEELQTKALDIFK